MSLCAGSHNISPLTVLGTLYYRLCHITFKYFIPSVEEITKFISEPWLEIACRCHLGVKALPVRFSGKCGFFHFSPKCPHILPRLLYVAIVHYWCQLTVSGFFSDLIEYELYLTTDLSECFFLVLGYQY